MFVIHQNEGTLVSQLMIAFENMASLTAKENLLVTLRYIIKIILFS